MADWSQNIAAISSSALSPVSESSLGVATEMLNVPASTATGVTNAAIYVPFVIQKRWVQSTAWWWNGAVVSGNIDVGLYDDQKNRLGSLGATAQAGTNTIQAVSITQTAFSPGRYYLGIGWSSATATLQAFGEPAGNVLDAMGVLSQSALGSATLPDPAVWVTTTFAFLPIFGISANLNV